MGVVYTGGEGTVTNLGSHRLRTPIIAMMEVRRLGSGRIEEDLEGRGRLRTMTRPADLNYATRPAVESSKNLMEQC